MALSERSRQEMFSAVEKAIGKEPALTLLEHLPPVGWADVVTKEYVDHEFKLLRSEMRADKAEMRSYIKTQLLSAVVLIVTLNSILLTAFKFIK